MKIFSRIYGSFYILMVLALSNACINTTKFLDEGEYLLYKQDIKKNHAFTDYTLGELYRQEPNTRLLALPIMPGVYIHNYYSKRDRKEKVEKRELEAQRDFKKWMSKSPEDSLEHQNRLEKRLEKINLYEKEGPLFNRQFGEAPAIFDEKLINETRDQISLLYFKNGYFDNGVKVNIDTPRKDRLNVTYLIEENKPTKVKEINYSTSDSTLVNFLPQNSEDFNSILSPSMIYNEADINDEIDRLERHFKNHGFYSFRKQFVFVEVNDTIEEYEVILNFDIHDPNEDNVFKQYKLQGVNFITESNLNLYNVKRDTIERDQIKFLQYRDKVSKKLLSHKIKLRPDQYYSLDYTQKTQRNIANLNMYRFTNIRFDSTKTGFYANIFTSPLNKYSTSFESGMAVTQGFPGPFGSLNFRNRNIFNGAEILDLSFNGAIEAQTSFSQENQIYQSGELSATATLTFPAIAIPSPIRHKFTDFNPRTKLAIGITNTQRPEYNRTNINASTRYSVSPSQSSTINFGLIDVSLLSTNIQNASFSQYLRDLQSQGNNLILSFGQSINTNVNLEYVFNDFNVQKHQPAQYFNIYLESGGSFWNALSSSFLLESNDTVFGLQYFRYAKTSADYRKYIPVGKTNTLAFRLKSGFALPYGLTEVMPYEKYFFLGGSNSLRSWRPRRLGPGSFANFNPDGSVNYDFEQPGEILLEANLEYRYKIISFLQGAFFIDAGNIWRVNEVGNLPGAEFELDRFYKEIAIGGGYGIRLDFSFLILRLDAGFKIYDPAQKISERFVIDNLFDINPFNREKTLWNIGIGYPF